MEVFPAIPPECLEWRRFRALYLNVVLGIQRDIAEALDVAEEALSRWLARRPVPVGSERFGAGRPGEASQALRGGGPIDPRTPLARAGGIWLPRPCWTCACVAHVIEKKGKKGTSLYLVVRLAL